ncbi:hypothetical protein [Erwinia tracheiphila]|nr:hypothetical protein [Erwinia tracheiphila]EOS94144.1 hypothetical protein ETR_15296 [Erwinia tracheiphila PSU-1]
MRCVRDIERTALHIGIILKGGPVWALGLPLSKLILYQHWTKKK